MTDVRYSEAFLFCPIFVILFNLTSSILKSNFLFVKSFCSLELLILKINRRHQTKMKIIDGSRQNEASKPKDNGDVRLVCLENQKGTRRWLWISWTRIPVENSPLVGWRHVAVRDQRTAIDYAYVLRDLADVHFPDAEKIMLVQDNLNTHKPASLYKAFPPTEARRIAERFEWHYTPKHGSWMNIAECEISVLARQCLDRRIPEQASLETELNAWTTTRNAKKRSNGNSRPRMPEPNSHSFTRKLNESQD